MDYKKFGNSLYIRFDKADEIVAGIMAICEKEKIVSATYSGIGCCSEVVVSSYIPKKNLFKEETKTGVLDIVSLNGNISLDENNKIYSHTHAMFSFLDSNGNIALTGGHLIKATILYTAEIVINPVAGGMIRRMKDPITRITVWKL
ncbi:MAG: DUF296 domain-containing protein [Alphaproteobacteria bacterium]|nr:DUF296 domain-containing protein [Alphaproteobacteria bacterium]